MTEFDRLVAQLKASPTVCNLMQFFSHETWEKIKFVRLRNGFSSRRHVLKMYETTVTQNWIYYFKIFSTAHPSRIEMSESRNEKANGNDIELAIQTVNGIILVPLQAKIIGSGLMQGDF